MSITIFRDMSPGRQFLFTGFIVVVVFLLVQLLAAVLAIPLFGFNQMLQMVSGLDFNDPSSMRLLKYLQVWQAVGLFILPSLIVAWMFHEDWTEYLHLRKIPTVAGLLMVFLLTFAMNPFINFTGEINSRMHFPEWLSGLENWMRNAEDTAEKLTKAFLKVENVSGLLFNLFMIAVLPALGEELLFRGVVQKLFSRITRNVHWGVWLSAALFSALHMQFYGFIPRMLLGGIFGYMLVWSGSLWLPIVAHFFNNAAAVILLYLIDKKAIGPAIEEFGSGPDQWYIALISLGIGVILLAAIRREFRITLPTSGLQHPDY
jgi:uncharacterized protein